MRPRYKTFLSFIILGWLLLSAFCTLALAAWANADGTCSAASEAASTTSLACTVGTTFNSGNVVILVIAKDNVSTTDGDNSETTAPTDTDGHTWTKACEFTNSQAAAAAGATVAVWFTKLTSDLASPDTITGNWASAVTDKAIHAHEFTIGAGNVVSVEGACQTLANDGADAGSQTISGMASGEYLFFRAVATESNAALSMTATTSYSLPDDPTDGCNNTTGGGEATDMGACSEYRIFTGTGDTSDPALVDTTNDNASVYVALKEAAPATVFPMRRTVEICRFQSDLVPWRRPTEILWARGEGRLVRSKEHSHCLREDCRAACPQRKSSAALGPG